MVNLHDVIFNSGIRLSLGKGLNKLFKTAAARSVSILQKLSHNIGPHKKQLTLITDAECRIQVQQMKVLPDHIQAKTVDRGDLGMMDQCGLHLKMAILRILP